MSKLTPEQIHKTRIQAFLTLAEREMTSARLLKEAVPEHGAYFLQQAVEKLLRAVLEWEVIPAEPSHNIQMLSDLLGKQHALYEIFVNFDILSSASTRYRYPTDKGTLKSISTEQVQEILVRVEALQQSVTRFLQERT